MYPVLFRLGEFPVPSYGMVYLVAFLAAVALFAHLARQSTDLSFGRLFEMGFQVAIAGEVGARLVFVIVEWRAFAAGEITLRQFVVAGRVVLGGVVAGGLFAWYLFRKHRLSLWRSLDASFTGVALGMAIGRLACLLAGCCFGKPTDWAWGITFTHPLAERLNGTPLHIPLHPTQPILFLLGLAVLAVLLWTYRRQAEAGVATGLFFLLSGATRFAVEYLRGDPRGAFGGLTTSQWIGIAMAVGGAGILYRALRAPGKQGARGPAHRQPAPHATR